MGAALEGTHVVEIANYVAGPYAGMLLGDLGAEVIKVEMPLEGDPYRAWEAGLYSSAFYAHNRNKKSIVLDLRSARGREVAQALARRADVLIENSRVGAMDRLGLGYAALSQVNPRLVYCSITGFGGSGPDSERPGYDTLGQAMSGLLSQLTDMDRPEPMGISLADHMAGLFTAYGALGALMAREHTGLGQYVGTSLLQSSMALVAENLTRYLASGEVLTRASRARTAQVFAFKDRDGAPFVIHLSSPDKFWQALLDAVGRSDLAGDPRFATRAARQQNREAVQELLDGIFAQGTRAEWLDRLQAHDVPCGPLSALNEVVEDPQVQHLGMIQEVAHPAEGAMRVVKAGVSLGSTPLRLGAAPVLDEHREEILVDLGFPPDYLATSGG
jgi:crotonobetainyl-CoA:carnitine CoA-transferase CaiB-like acyl-CoA transferase